MRNRRPGLFGALAAGAFAVCSVAAKPVPIVFDTDITGDVDDVLALAMLHALADRDAVDLLAVTISKRNDLAAPFVDAVNTFYGRPDLPIGTNEEAPYRESKYLRLAEERNAAGSLRYPRDIGIGVEPEDAIVLLRKTLSAMEDSSVAIVQVGLATNLSDLLESGPDLHSNLSGKELIARKVKLLSVMAGAFETIAHNNRYLEANVVNHVAAMQHLATEWPAEVPVVWSGFKVGVSAPYPRESIAEDFEYSPHHIVREAYLLHSGPDHDRPTWDLTSVLYAVYPDRGYFDLSVPGRVSVEGDGFTRFDSAHGSRFLRPRPLREVAPEQKRDRYLLMSGVQSACVREALVQLVSQPPRMK